MSRHENSPANPSSTRGERTRAAILDATMERLRQQGYENTTATEIAEDAGVSQASVFAHFGSKNGLLAAAIRTYYLGLVEEMEAQALGAGAPRDRLRAMMRSLVKQNAQDWRLAKVVVRHGRFADDEEVLEAYRESTVDLNRRFLGVLGDLRAVGEIDPDLPLGMLRDALLGTSEHFILGLATVGRRRNLQAAADHIVDLVLRGAAPSSATSGPSLASLDAKLDCLLKRLD